jgi:hypothetical protein
MRGILAAAEAVRSHPGENGRWELKKASKHPCASEWPGQTGKKDLQISGAGRKSRKRAAQVVVKKSYGKSQVKALEFHGYYNLGENSAINCVCKRSSHSPTRPDIRPVLNKC